MAGSATGNELEMILSHDGGEWVARGCGWQVRGRTWADLDRALRRRLRDDGGFDGRVVRVCMRFDMDALPRWLRQYSGHYFNRRVELSPAAPGGVADRCPPGAPAP